MPAYELTAIVNPPAGSYKKKMTIIALPAQVQKMLTQIGSLLRDQLTTYYLPFTIHYSLLTTYYLVLTTYYENLL